MKQRRRANTLVACRRQMKLVPFNSRFIIKLLITILVSLYLTRDLSLPRLDIRKIRSFLFSRSRKARNERSRDERLWMCLMDH